MEKCPPPLSPVGRTPSNPHSSDTLSTAGKTFKLLPLLGLSWTDGARLPSTSSRSLSLPECSDSPWCPSPLITKPQCTVDRVSKAGLRGQGCRLPECLSPPCSVPFLLLEGWDEGRAGLLTDPGSASLPFSVWSVLHQVSVVCSAVFRSFSGSVVSAIVVSLLRVRGSFGRAFLLSCLFFLSYCMVLTCKIIEMENRSVCAKN